MTFFSSLITLARIHRTVLNRSDASTSKHPFLVSNVMEKAFILSPLSVTLALGFSQMLFTLLRKFSSIIVFWECYHEWVLNFTKFFFCIYGDDHMLVFLVCLFFRFFGPLIHYIMLIMILMYSIWMLNQSCILYLVTMYYPPYMLLDLTF